MPARKIRTLITLTAAAILFGVGAVAVAQSMPQIKLRYTFEQGIAVDDQGRQYVDDVSSSDHRGYLRSTNGGEITTTSGANGVGTAAKFPDYCAGAGCPKALLETDSATSGDLDPGSAPFSFGADVKLQPEETSGGSNIVQKGLYADPGGQWKLQVDGQRPSCRVNGVLGDDQATTNVQVVASVSVADGNWHRISCRKEANRLLILVDGRVNRIQNVPTGVGSVDNSAPVNVGAKNLNDANDQFHGTLDNVFFRLD